MINLLHLTHNAARLFNGHSMKMLLRLNYVSTSAYYCVLENTCLEACIRLRAIISVYMFTSLGLSVRVVRDNCRPGETTVPEAGGSAKVIPGL